MLSGFSSNVVLSKARAKYGKRLTAQNYNDLLSCQSVAEVADYLKNQTDYGKVLSGMPQSEIHRGRLEARLRQKLLEDNASLCRYEITVGEDFSQYFIRRNEIEQILRAVLFLDAGTPEDFLFTMPMFLMRHSRVDFKALGRIRSFDDLLGVLAHTPYQKILEPFRPKENGWINFAGIENALYSFLYSFMSGMIDRRTSGETARQLGDILKSFLDLTNFISIVRLKLYYHANPEAIRKVLLPYGNFSEHVFDRLLACNTQEEFLSVLRSTSLGKHTLQHPHDSIGMIPQKMNFRLCRHYINFSTHPPVVLISYVFLNEAEMHDIVTIVEGIRYRLSPDEIRKLLVVVNY